jgi:hypothetical protein
MKLKVLKELDHQPRLSLMRVPKEQSWGGKRKRTNEEVESSSTSNSAGIPHKKASTVAAGPCTKRLYEQALSDS